MRARADMFQCWPMHQVRMLAPERGDERFACDHKLAMAVLQFLRHFGGYVRGHFTLGKRGIIGLVQRQEI